MPLSTLGAVRAWEVGAQQGLRQQWKLLLSDGELAGGPGSKAPGALLGRALCTAGPWSRRGQREGAGVGWGRWLTHCALPGSSLQHSLR